MYIKINSTVAAITICTLGFLILRNKENLPLFIGGGEDLVGEFGVFISFNGSITAFLLICAINLIKQNYTITNDVDD
jgi:hypothetical protein